MLKKLKYMFKFCKKILQNWKKLFAKIDNILDEEVNLKNQFLKSFGYWPEGLEYNDINVLRLTSGSSVGKQNRLLIAETKYPCSPKESIISLGKNCWTGVGVELNIIRGCQIILKDYSTIQDYCKILGDVTIEKYSAVASGAYISSGQHYVEWRNPDIRLNQDKLHLNDEELIKKHSKPVHIEEDCWIGYNCFILAGVYIGRGAQIGANTVVNKDVMPYSLVSGVIGQQHQNFRFDFFPPSKIDASIADHRPYFYRGFNHKNDEDEIEKDPSLITANVEKCIFILQKKKIDQIKIIGKIFFLQTFEKLAFDLIYNGNVISSSFLQIEENGLFRLNFNINDFEILKQKSKDLVFVLAKNCNVFQLSYKKVENFDKLIFAISSIEEVFTKG